MPLVSENYHNQGLQKYNINIKTKYIVDSNILERNTDGRINDDIKNGIRCKKEYFLNNKLIHIEKKFDTRIEYTFVSSDQENNDFVCNNCGMTSKLKDFIDGCPYCRSHYNIEYTDKDLGSKYHYDRVLKNTVYRTITAVIDLVISLLISFVYIKMTSRTFNNYDVTKIFIYGFVLALVLYYFFYIIDAYVILYPLKKYKDKQNEKQIIFWETTKIDKKTFFNNLNYEVSKKYYKQNGVIDYDILDYLKFQMVNKDSIEVKVYVRVVYYKNNKIFSKYFDDIYILKRNEKDIIKVNNGVNLIKCNNCGATIDINKGYCEYCNSKINYLQEWIIEED